MHVTRVGDSGFTVHVLPYRMTHGPFTHQRLGLPHELVHYTIPG